MPPQLRLINSPFTCSSTLAGFGIERVHVSGELDIATSPHLADALLASQARARVVELDLRDLEFIDSSAVHVILDAAVRAGNADQRLVLLRSRRNVDRIFTLTGAADALEITDIAQWERCS